MEAGTPRLRSPAPQLRARSLPSVVKRTDSAFGDGALGGVIVFLIWLWLSNLVILVGAEFNVVLERGRRLQARDAPG